MNFDFEMIFKAVTQIILIHSLTLYKTGKGQQDNQPIDYAKLELNKHELLGSRWAIDHPRKITVYHAFQIVDMVKVDVNDMSIRVDFHMRQRWEAEGLDFPQGLFKDEDKENIYISADENVLKSVWSPDSFIPNARDAKILSITTSHSAVNIYKNRTIIYKARMYAVLGCSFTFQWYPLDIQICDLFFESYKYGSKLVIYEWEPIDPVTALPGILLYQYDFFLPPKLSKGYQRRWAGQADYPYVKMTFKFERKLGNNIIQIYVPTILVVILSFFSFWLGLDAVPGRISLLITCILTLVTMHSGLKGVIPPVHYIKMIDIWMIGCMVFVFGAICEFIIIKYLKWRIDQAATVKEEQKTYLRKNGLLPPSAPPRPPAIHNGGNGGGKMIHIPNAIYPEFGQQHANKNGNFNQQLSHSKQKQQAWQNAQMQAFSVHSEYPDFTIRQHGSPVDYPGFINVPGMPIYNQQIMQLPPPARRPFWVKIDRVCRLLFPLLFAIFNAAYWPILLIGAGKQHLDE